MDLPDLPELQAPAGWRTIDIVSDLHLQAGEPATHQAWQACLNRADRADALFILGDFFEVWVGDDLLDAPPPREDTADRAFWRHCATELRNFARRTPTFFIAGNRDFLLGIQGLAVAMLGLAALGGCAGLRLGMQKPEVTVANIRLLDGNLLEQRFLLTLRVEQCYLSPPALAEPGLK